LAKQLRIGGRKDIARMARVMSSISVITGATNEGGDDRE